MRLRIPLLLSALALLVIGCASTADDGPEVAGGDDDVISRRRVDGIVERAQCAAGNASHSVENYDRATFDAARALEDIKRAHPGGCDGRKYSNSRENGVAMFESFLAETEGDGWFEGCQNWPTLKRDLVELLKDPT